MDSNICLMRKQIKARKKIILWKHSFTALRRASQIKSDFVVVASKRILYNPANSIAKLLKPSVCLDCPLWKAIFTALQLYSCNLISNLKLKEDINLQLSSVYFLQLGNTFYKPQMQLPLPCWRKLGGGSFKCQAEEAGGKGEIYKCDERVELQWFWSLRGWRQRNLLILKLDQENVISFDLS